MVYLTIIKYYLYISITEKPINKTSYTRKKRTDKNVSGEILLLFNPIFKLCFYIFHLEKCSLFPCSLL
ncbi:hypothetical protein HQ29_04445 [Porphyromonas canoris]|nr:hypothetical protein HQ29_04445 [Porphyromonas canoris]